MNQWWAMPMLLSGGLFVGGVVAIAWERVPAWRASDPVDFQSGFAHTLRQLDRLQPALLVVCLGSTIAFASSTSGAARTLATLAAGGLLVVLVGSVDVLVPIQRRLVASESPPLSAVEALRARWVWRPPGAQRRRAGGLVHRPHHNWIGLLQLKEPVR